MSSRIWLRVLILKLWSKCLLNERLQSHKSHCSYFLCNVMPLVEEKLKA
jgi:hypothetical protein